MVWDSESYEAGALSNNSYEDKEVLRTSQGCHTCNRTDQKPEDTLNTWFSSNASDGNFSELVMSRGPNTIHFAVKTVLWLHRSVVHTLDWAPASKKAMKRHI